MEFRSVWTQPEGCPWSIATSSSWLSGSSRRQDGDLLSITAAPNPDPSPRTGTISFSGHIITITQAQNCTYQVSPTNIDIPARGGFIPVQVTTPPGCTWTYSRNGDANWYTSGASGNNTGSLSFFIGAGENNWAFPRTGTVTVAGQTLRVQQPTPISGLRFLPITPCRVADTRGGVPYAYVGPPALAANQPRWINLGYSGCRQGDDTALAYSLNVTVVPNTTLSYLTVYPYDADRPFVSTLNSFNGRVVANAAIVPSGYNYSLQLFATDPTHAIVDVNGYFVKDTDPRGLAFYPVTPCRAADTRQITGPRAGTTVFPIVSIGCGVPINAAAYSLNVTSVPSGPLPYLTLWPTGIPQPVVSTLNSFDGQVVANAAIVAAGVSGSVSVFNAAPSDTILDVNGYFAPPGAPGALRFFPVNPCRVADTRSHSGMPGPFGAPQLAAGGSREIPIPQSACGIPSTAKAYALNVTAVPPGPLGYVTVWPSGLPRPTVSTLNSFNGQVVANAAIVPAGTNGAVMFYTSLPTDLVIDINGYFAP